MLLSGGVDSTVCAALLRKSLTREGQVIAIHIDNGFMRKNESEQVKASLEKLGLQLKGRTNLHLLLLVTFRSTLKQCSLNETLTKDHKVCMVCREKLTHIGLEEESFFKQ